MRFLRPALAALMALGIAAPAVGQGSAVDKAQQTSPSPYLRLYNMGLVYMARGDRAPAGGVKLRYYRTAAGWLEKALNAPGRQSAGEEGYAIFNALGATYLALGDLQKADSYLQQGLKNEARLSAASRGRLYGNLGYLYALQGDPRRARLYFEKGASLGNAFAKENMRRLDSAKIR